MVEKAWRTMESAPSDGRRFKAKHHETIRITWWGKTSHIPLYGWCYGRDVENVNLWSPSYWKPL